MSIQGAQDPQEVPNPPSREHAGQIAFYVPVSTSIPSSNVDAVAVFQLLWRRRYTVGVTAVLLGLLALGGSYLLPNIYRAEVLMAPAQKDENAGAMTDLSGLAVLAGITLPRRANTEEDLAILSSRTFIWKFVNKHDLLPILFQNEWDASLKTWKDPVAEDQPTLWDAYRLVSDDILRVSTDRRTGLIRVNVDWSDPKLAAVWANALVSELNEYLRVVSIERSEMNLTYLVKELERSEVMELRQTLHRLIASEQQEAMLANTQREFAFRVLDPATPPDRKVRPQRALISILSAFAGALAAASFILIQSRYRTTPQTSA